MAEVLILADPHLLTITWVTNALKATTVLKDLTKPLSVHQALIIHLKEWTHQKSADCVLRTPLRPCMGKLVANRADNLPHLWKAQNSAPARACTELIPQLTLHAGA